MPRVKVLVDNVREKVAIKWDGTRFAIIQSRYAWDGTNLPSTVIILNPREMLDLIEFAGKQGGN